MKKVMVTSCSHSHGRPRVRVTISHTTVTVNPVMAIPQRIIRMRSSGSSARHFRWRLSWSTSAMVLLDAAHQAEHLDRVRAEALGDRILHRRRDLLEARLVHLVDDLHAHLRKLG